jgi:hypothetical protein
MIFLFYLSIPIGIDPVETNEALEFFIIYVAANLKLSAQPKWEQRSAKWVHASSGYAICDISSCLQN